MAPPKFRGYGQGACFLIVPGRFQEVNGSSRQIRGNGTSHPWKWPVKAMVLVGVAVGYLIGCFGAHLPQWKTGTSGPRIIAIHNLLLGEMNFEQNYKNSSENP